MVPSGDAAFSSGTSCLYWQSGKRGLTLAECGYTDCVSLSSTVHLLSTLLSGTSASAKPFAGFRL